MTDYTQKLQEKDSIEKVKIRREVNAQTGEIRNKDPKWLDYDEEVIKKKAKYKEQTVKKEERFFNLVTEFQTMNNNFILLLTFICDTSIFSLDKSNFEEFSNS